MCPPPPLPARIGPVEFAEFGRMVAVRCPQDFAHILQRAGSVWEPGTRRWLVERRRIGPVIRTWADAGRGGHCDADCRANRMGFQGAAELTSEAGVCVLGRTSRSARWAAPAASVTA